MPVHPAIPRVALQYLPEGATEMISHDLPPWYAQQMGCIALHRALAARPHTGLAGDGAHVWLAIGMVPRSPPFAAVKSEPLMKVGACKNSPCRGSPPDAWGIVSWRQCLFAPSTRLVGDWRLCSDRIKAGAPIEVPLVMPHVDIIGDPCIFFAHALR